MGEFSLIQAVFTRRAAAMLATQPDSLVALGIGDDCALLNRLSSDEQMAISTDMFVEGTHFFPGVAARDIGHKALAVNLSDLAAMGAKPIGFTLALALPQADESFLHELANGLFELAQIHHCPLIGGDTTRGPLSICITVFGRVKRQQALRRGAARVGQRLWVSGQLGGAALAVQQLYANQTPPATALASLLRPAPQVFLGLALNGLASSAIDLSDGLYGDLRHIATASQVNVEIDLNRLPIDPLLEGLPFDAAMALALCGGDDYQLAFTCDDSASQTVSALSQSLQLRLTPIGKVVAKSAAPQVICLGPGAVPLSATWHQQLSAYEHF
jgi:thiamine-monophosphate kinase